ncbi:molybdopterin-dependent oxidoreductase [Chloroflexota bacterium]
MTTHINPEYMRKMVDEANNKGNTEVKKIVCWASPGCVDQCSLLATVKDGRIEKLTGNQQEMNGARLFHSCPDRLPHLLKWLYYPDQLMYPLKRAGERGENKWERISWDQALDEIGNKLKKLKEQYGAECLAVTEGTARSDTYAARTRLLNLFGNPRNIGDPGMVCHQNNAALRNVLLGTKGKRSNMNIATCWVIDGWNVSESWRRMWQELKDRRKRGDTVKLIVVDPRETDSAKEADLWLQIRPGTDGALFLAWINVIIEENLYDKDFVDQWTFGFDHLKQRTSEYTPERVAEITWVPAEKIRESARMYATSKPASFGNPGGVAPDEIGLNGIRVEQVRICLRAITGNLRADGGETPLGPGPIIDGKMGIRDSMLQMEEKCSPEQRKKLLGADRFKLMAWPAYEIASKLYKETYGITMSMSGHDFLCPQPLIWRAILTEKPYPIKAMITWSSNPLLNAANTKLVYQALKSSNLDLHVVLEHVMTPTALLADYVLPIASKLEKPMCSTGQDGSASFQCGERAMQPLGERRTDYDFFRELAIRLDFGEEFPWKTEEELAEYRLAPLGVTFKEATEKRTVASSEPWTYETKNPKTGKPTGFATPSGKVELYSNVLEELGYDPLPFYEEPPESHIRTPDIAKDYPLILTTGGRYRPLFHAEHRQPGIGMREQHPEPLLDIHPNTARELGIADGDWAYIETLRGRIKQKAKLTTGIDPRVVNAESHWWFPEQPAEEPHLHGMWQSNANVLTLDDPDTLDPVTGGWALRALLCKVYKIETP